VSGFSYLSPSIQGSRRLRPTILRCFDTPTSGCEAYGFAADRHIGIRCTPAPSVEGFLRRRWCRAHLAIQQPKRGVDEVSSRMDGGFAPSSSWRRALRTVIHDNILTGRSATRRDRRQSIRPAWSARSIRSPKASNSGSGASAADIFDESFLPRARPP